MKPFELRSLPDGQPRVYLVQLPFKTSAGIDSVDEIKTHAKLDGSQLDAVRALLVELVGAPNFEAFLKDGGLCELDEAKAVRLKVAFDAIDNLRKKDRMEDMIAELQKRDDTFVAMWFKMLAADKTGNMKQALRVALTGDA